MGEFTQIAKEGGKFLEDYLGKESSSTVPGASQWFKDTTSYFANLAKKHFPQAQYGEYMHPKYLPFGKSTMMHSMLAEGHDIKTAEAMWDSWHGEYKRHYNFDHMTNKWVKKLHDNVAINEIQKVVKYHPAANAVINEVKPQVKQAYSDQTLEAFKTFEQQFKTVTDGRLYDRISNILIPHDIKNVDQLKYTPAWGKLVKQYDTDTEFRKFMNGINAYSAMGYRDNPLPMMSKLILEDRLGEMEKVFNNTNLGHYEHFKTRDTTPIDSPEELFSYAQELVDNVRNATESPKEIYRGMNGRIPGLSDGKVGDLFDVRQLSSFTVNPKVGRSFAGVPTTADDLTLQNWIDDQNAVYGDKWLKNFITVVPGSKGVKIYPYNNYNEWEVIIQGRFKILSNEPHPLSDKIRMIKVEHVGVF